MPRIQINTTPENERLLDDLAIKLGYTSQRGNPKRNDLIVAIATGKVATAPASIDAETQQALSQGLSLLQAHPGFPAQSWEQFRGLLEKFQHINTPSPVVSSIAVEAISRKIENSESFILIHEERKYKVVYGEMVSRYSERLRMNCLYLDARLEDPVDEPRYYPEPLALSYNRSFRLDRNYQITPYPEGRWYKEGLQKLEITLYLPDIAGQAWRYKLSPSDLDWSEVEGGILLKHQITSFYWFWEMWGKRIFAVVAPEDVALMALHRRELQLELQKQWRKWLQ